MSLSPTGPPAAGRPLPLETIAEYDSPLPDTVDDALRDLVLATGQQQLTTAEFDRLLALPGAQAITVGLYARLVGFALHVPSEGLALALSGSGSRTLVGLVVARVGWESGVVERLLEDVAATTERVVAALSVTHPALRVLRGEQWRTVGTQASRVILAAPSHPALAVPDFDHA